MRIVLKPYWIAEECFLQEAFMWVAFYHFPLSEIMPDYADFRFDPNQHDNYYPNIPNSHLYITNEEAIRVGLPTNPRWNALLEVNHIPEMWFFDPDLSNSSDSFVEQVTGKSIGQEEKENAIKLAFEDLYPDMDFEEVKKEALIRSEEQKKWDEKYEEYSERIKAKIFVALCEGSIAASGRAVPQNIDELKNHGWTDSQHDLIPSEYWRLESIDWEQSASDNKKGHYCHILVNTEQLMSVFPSPDPEQAKSVQIIADQYILNEEDASKPMIKGNRGRPPNNWNTFYLEVTSRVLKGELPEKKEAFISDMQEWCLKNWSKQIGRSTIHPIISPFYQKFKEQKNVRK